MMTSSRIYQRNPDGSPRLLLGFAREIDVIRLISTGMTDKEIGEKLKVSIHTAKTHRKRILKKLGLRNTAALV